METKQIFSLLLIAGFVAVAVFGVFAMHPQNSHGAGCIAAIAKGQPCLGEKDIFASLNFHINSFKEFSTAVFGGTIFAAFILFAALALALASILGQPTNFVTSCQARRFSEQRSLPLQRKFIHWLARHENSPNFA